jgi:hypothetical protein
MPLQVVVNAPDSTGLASVTVSFDVNGDGQDELLAAFPVALSGIFGADFPDLSGPTGTREITATAIDNLGNYATVVENVNVVNPPK